ncbi:MAG TPA: DUF4199 domain-containing protein [Opitutaceae bacterium]|nr:DUF4199 domain-containing protein [Opitutaceae bacterium]
MKTPLTYGVFLALASCLLTLVLYFGGFHSDSTKFHTAELIGNIANPILSIIFICLAMRTARQERPLGEPYGYGSALGTGVLTALTGALIIAIFGVIYSKFINPNFVDVLIESKVAQMQAQGKPQQMIDGAEKFMHMMFNPAVQLLVGIIFGTVFGTIISLIAAIFFRRKTTDLPPEAPLAA